VIPILWRVKLKEIYDAPQSKRRLSAIEECPIRFVIVDPFFDCSFCICQYRKREMEATKDIFQRCFALFQFFSEGFVGPAANKSKKIG